MRLPVIDLGVSYQVIDESGDKPRWKTVGKGVDSVSSARAVARKLGLKNIWINDGLGRRLAQ
jgi:hypothetical protein